ncbi:MAG: hypothetical protein K5931_04580 [Lachnospiraceae bacterium]|nr:hypothetical protein [Lachnospiraceae bacterium]
MEENYQISKNNILSISMILLGACIIFFTGDSGRAAGVRWIGSVILIAFLMRPLFLVNKLSFPDGGFSLGFCFGLAVAFLFSWFPSALFLTRFDTVTVWAGLLIPAFLGNYYIVHKKKYFYWDKKRISSFMFGAALFVLLFAIAYYFKGFRADIGEQTEQFMDFGFMQTMFRQKALPPKDLWFSGELLNYYYLGQAISVYLTRLSFNRVEYGYNFMLCTIFAAFFLTVFSLVSAVALNHEGVGKKRAWLGGLGAALVTACGSNGHYLIYGIILPLWERISGRELVKDFWFADPTSFIGHFEGSTDLGKHEYPAYTVILGDLHAHVINMLFTIPLLAILFDYCLSYREERKLELKEEEKEEAKEKESGFLHSLKSGWSFKHIFCLGILLGLFRGINYWDFPIYFIISGAVILFCDIKSEGLKLVTFLKVLLKGLVILIIGTVLMIPFNLHFIKMSSSVGICDRHSLFWQFAIVWWPFIITTVIITICLFKRIEKEKNNIRNCRLYLTEMAIALCGIGLIITPEILYVKDIYGDKYQRYNTMFKFTYQAFILFGLLIGISIAVFSGKRFLARSYSVIVTFLAFVSGTYILLSSYLWMGNVWDVNERKDISAFDFLKKGSNSYGIEWEAIEKLNEDKREVINIAEGSGDSYSDVCKLSVFTGANTVVGWNVHEWLWRSNWDIVGSRQDELRRFFECGEPEYCRNFLEKYDIDYIYIGPKERENYRIWTAGFENFASEIWQDQENNTTLYKIDKE